MGIQCVILAGGLATRMFPTTQALPKSLLSVGSDPFIHHQLSWIKKTGVDEVVLLVGHLGSAIREYVGDGSKWDIKVSYVDEGEKLRGMAGALRLAFDEGVLAPAFLLTYGDSFLPISFSQVMKTFRDRKSKAMMTVFRNEGKWDTSNVWYDDGLVLLYDKERRDPATLSNFHYIDYGLLVLSSEIIEQYIPPKEKYDLSHVLHRLSRERNLAGMEITERFYEIGSPSGLDDFRKWMGNSQLPQT